MERLDVRDDVRVHSREVVRDPEGRARFLAMAESVGFEARGVPVTIVGSQHWIGFHPTMEAELEQAIAACRAHRCRDPRAPDDGPARVDDPAAPEPTAGRSRLSLPWVGEVDLRGRSLFVSTILIAFVDGFNPCSLWALTILLSLVLNVGSRKRILLVGGTFLTVTALIYGLFIVGLFQVMALISWLDGARIAVARFALSSPS